MGRAQHGRSEVKEIVNTAVAGVPVETILQIPHIVQRIQSTQEQPFKL